MPIAAASSRSGKSQEKTPEVFYKTLFSCWQLKKEKNRKGRKREVIEGDEKGKWKVELKRGRMGRKSERETRVT